MPRGDNPNSRANLRRFGYERDAREACEHSNEAQRAQREVLKAFIELDKESTTNEERAKMLEMLKKRAMQGNLRAFEIYANYMGLKPAEKIAVSAVDEDAINGLKEAIAKRKNAE